MSTSTSSNTTSAQQRQTLQISSTASAKILRHAIQYTTGSIHGALLGQFHYPSNPEEGPMLEVHDCIPICHSAPTKPILDMSFRMMQSHIDSNLMNANGGEKSAPLQIVGWYTTNDRVDDIKPNQAALRIIASIASQKQQHYQSSSSLTPPPHSEPIVLMVNAVKVAAIIAGDTTKHPFVGYGRDVRKQWLKEIPMDAFLSNTNPYDDVCQWEEKDVPLYDFESHLESVGSDIQERDWLNNSRILEKLNA